jgi:hypothetical protein
VLQMPPGLARGSHVTILPLIPAPYVTIEYLRVYGNSFGERFSMLESCPLRSIPAT